MEIFAKVLLALVYMLVLPVRWMRFLLGRDTLRLRRPLNAASYWVVRERTPNSQSYFSEASVAEGHRARLEGSQILSDPGAGHWLVPILRLIARLYAPPRELVRERYANPADREQGIPDEVYTLW